MRTSPDCHAWVIAHADHARVTSDTASADSPAHYRAVWISDVHLGTSECQAGHLLDFLRSFECERLYLVGDIIDGWQLRRGFYWHRSHNDVIQKLLRKARKGTRVVYVPGNHDEAARQFIGLAFGDIEIVDETVHELADGRRLWVTHGDLYDGVIQHAKWLAYVGDQAYEFTLQLNRRLNSLRARLGLPYWSLSKYLKHKVKRAVGFITDFEKALAAETRRRGLDGVVCGHIHHAELRDIDGVLYANDGDWVESLTALVEHADGRLEIVDWAARVRAEAAQRRSVRAARPPEPIALPAPVPSEPVTARASLRG
ncbi:UDP-2,3-diacylglucosamine diphosphatase [Derxia lacustris]|uniref:UDP-2,3-diacylglucosamine diphosphatase n=1 Tax=Derxia lacustris TaxID=764842 RepID=UPI000A17445D|nr:UDP-2,3-diacylglucosamine diphosphatase [Derxia lacustris]